MKKVIFFTLLVFYLLELNAQEVSLPPKFFTLRNARISTGLGFDWGVNLFNGTPQELNNIIDSSRTFNYCLNFDLYAPNSFLGFMVGINYGNWKTYFKKDQIYESIFVRTIELPLYLKLRFGRIEKTSRLLLLLGASYIIPISISRNYSYSYADDNINQVQGIKTLTGMFGYEQYLGERSSYKANNPKGTYDRMRVVFFLRYSYALDGRINTNYYQSSKTNSVLNEYPGLEYTDMSITFGILYFFRLGIF